MTWKEILKTKEEKYRSKRYASKAIPYDYRGAKMGDRTPTNEGFKDKYDAAFRESLPDFPFKHGGGEYGKDTVEVPRKAPNKGTYRKPRVTRQLPRSALFGEDGRQIQRHNKP